MTKSTNNSPSFKDVYELVDDRTTRIDGKIEHLSNRFDKLEAGRLSMLETKYAQMNADIMTEIANIKANNTIQSNKVLIIWSMIIIAVNFAGAYVIKVIQ